MEPLQIVAAVGGLSFVLGSLVTGARLLLVARRTRQLPELACGFGLFLMGGLGYPMTLLGEHGSFLPDLARSSLIMTNTLTSVLGLTLFCVFTTRVFRPQSPVARATVWAMGFLFCFSFVYRLMTYGYAPIALGGQPQLPLHSVLTILALTWAGAESLIYHGRLRKRMMLGLTDAILVNRMWMWAQGMFAAALLTGIASTAQMLGIAFNQSTIGMLTIGVLGTLAAASIWLAFFAPHAYESWIRSRSEAPGDSSAA